MRAKLYDKGFNLKRIKHNRCLSFRYKMFYRMFYIEEEKALNIINNLCGEEAILFANRDVGLINDMFYRISSLRTRRITALLNKIYPEWNKENGQK